MPGKIISAKTRNLKKKSLGEKFAEWAVGKFAPKHHMRLKPKKGLKRKKRVDAPGKPMQEPKPFPSSLT